MRVRFWCGLALTLAACGAQASERADFTTGEGTNLWTISSAEYLSPTYDGAVDRISLSCSGDVATGSAEILALPQEGDETPVATLSAAANAATFDFPDTTDFRAFQISTSGDWRLLSFAADLSSSFLDAPTGVVVSNNTTGSSFDMSWSPVAGATGYRVYVWTNVTSEVLAGTGGWAESFSNAPATSSTSTQFKDSYTDDNTPGWRFKTVYACSEAGAIRIGGSTTQGVLASPCLPRFQQQSPTLRIRAKRQDDSDGTNLTVCVISEGDGVTNNVAVIALTTSFDRYETELTGLQGGGRIMLQSPTPTSKLKSRVILDEVAIISDYYVPSEVPDYIVNGLDAGGGNSCSLSGLPSVPVDCAVVAVGRRGAASEKSASVQVDLANPDKVATLNAFPLSALAGSVYSQDFDSLLSFDGKNWLNGLTLPYWQAWLDDSAVTEFKSGSTAGMRKFSSSTVTCALGATGRQRSEVYWGLSFTNDTGEVIRLSSVSYVAQQWGFANTVEHPLSFSVLVTNRLDWMSSFDAGWTVCSSTPARYPVADGHATPIETEVSHSPAESIRIAPGDVLLVKWTLEPPSGGSSASMAIDDLSVTFQRPVPLSIHLVRSGM